jgi:hypothetical protein
MCFSASASFIAGATLSAVGLATLRMTKRKAEIPFAMIPLLFGVQQITEGMIWLSFRNESSLSNATRGPRRHPGIRMVLFRGGIEFHRLLLLQARARVSMGACDESNQEFCS